jgi:UDP-glucose 4-epimerase
MGEELLRRFADEHPEMSCRAARIFNPFGPRDRADRVVNRIVAAQKEGRPTELGNVWPKRDFVYVTDVAQALLLLSENGAPGFRAVNVGTGVGTTVLDLVGAIERATGGAVEVRRVAERERADDGHVVADASALRELGWRPRYDLESGLRRLLAAEGPLPA